MERRFRWNLRQVIAAVAEATRAAAPTGRKGGDRERAAFVEGRLGSLGFFAAAVDAGIGAIAQGKPFVPDSLKMKREG